MKLSKKRIIYNKVEMQNINSHLCGYYCIFIADALLHHPLKQPHIFKTVCNSFNNLQGTSKNELIIKKYFKNKMKYFTKGHNRMKGTGVQESLKLLFNEPVSRVKGFITGPTHAPPAVRELLAKHGDATIQTIQVGRTPLTGVIHNILKIVSLGEIEKNRKKLGYDDIYHLFLLITLSDGYSFKIERNQRVSVSAPSVTNRTQIISIPIDKEITLNQLIKNGENGSSEFWSYNPVTRNCQAFVKSILKRNGLLTPEADKFITQNAAKLLENSPLTEKFASKITDFSGRLDILLHGAGLKNLK
jgi:hypothetical protein